MKTEINIWVVLVILTMHWIADFILQTDGQAKGKSKNLGYLLQHTVVYSLFFIIPITILWGNGHTTTNYIFMSLSFSSVTFICHTIQDYFTSRLNSKLWAEGQVHDFFISVGLDQLLHFIQLILTYQIIISWH